MGATLSESLIQDGATVSSWCSGSEFSKNIQNYEEWGKIVSANPWRFSKIPGLHCSKGSPKSITRDFRAQLVKPKTSHPGWPIGPEIDEAGQSNVRNSSYNPTFERFKSLNFPISTILERLSDNPNMRKLLSSQWDANNEMCLVFHIKGLCKTKGRRARHPHGTTEYFTSIMVWKYYIVVSNVDKFTTRAVNKPYH